MKNIVAKNIKDLFMKSKFIFVPYERSFYANIFLTRIFDANIFYAEGGKK